MSGTFDDLKRAFHDATQRTSEARARCEKRLTEFKRGLTEHLKCSPSTLVWIDPGSRDTTRPWPLLATLKGHVFYTVLRAKMGDGEYVELRVLVSDNGDSCHIATSNWDNAIAITDDATATRAYEQWYSAAMRAIDENV